MLQRKAANTAQLVNGDCSTKNNSNKDLNSQSQLEDGELMIASEDIFTITFHAKHYHDKYAAKVTKAILDKLQNRDKGYNHKILTQTDGLHIKFTVSEKNTNACDSRIPNKVSEPDSPTNTSSLPTLSNTSTPTPKVSLPPEPTTCQKPLSPPPQNRSPSPQIRNIKDLFYIDTTPQGPHNMVQIPLYERAVDEILLDKESAEKKKRADEQKALQYAPNRCFNCYQNGHGTKNCPIPLNHRRIQDARKAQYKTERYCNVVDEYSHLKPGVISNKLRAALNIRDDELPFFFYRMRVLGYPPGWLEDSKIEHSGIELFDDSATSGSTRLNAENSKTENDVSRKEKSKEPSKYNMSQFISFPGFNQYPGPKYIDAYAQHNVPPFTTLQSKKEFIRRLGSKVFTGYGQQKLKNDTIVSNGTESANIGNIESTDMEIADSNSDDEMTNDNYRDGKRLEESEKHLVDEGEQQVATYNVPDSDDDDLTGSVSLSYLEEKQNEILKQLAEITSVDSLSLNDEVATIETNNKRTHDNGADLNEKQQKIPKSDEINPPPNAKIVNEKVPPKLSPATVNKSTEEVTIGSCKGVHMGTPILKFSPYDTLPRNENFKVGISDVINFENLSNSTGQYVKMQKVLRKVRTAVNKMKCPKIPNSRNSV